MKLTIILFIFFVFIRGWSLENNARLTVYSTPEKVQVRLDSVIIGSTPLINFFISEGDHRLELLSPYDGLWNTSNIVQNFTIKSGHDTTLHVRFQKKVKINSIPYHARLMQNNILLGKTPLSISFVENRGKEFSLEKKGYKSFRFVLEKPQSQLFTLEPIGADILHGEQNSFTYSLFHTRLKSKFLLLTGTVITHWFAFYFKNVADDNFEKYERTGNQYLMSKYWDKTQRYDRYSDISLGVSYIFLSGLIYTVLWR